MVGLRSCELLLKENGADVNVATASGWTPLMWAALNGYTNLAQILLDKGPNVSVKNARGLTAKDCAKRNGNEEIVKLLKAYSERK